MWITVASDRSRKFRSLTGRISDLDKQVGDINRISQSITNGLGSDAVSSDSILSGAVGSDAIETQSITADKIAPSVFQTASSGLQRVPAPLTATEYWNSAIYGNITAFSEAYFADKENKNVSVSATGITFSPEKNSNVIVSTAELLSEGLVVIETRIAHGYEIGDYIKVSNLGSPLDGEWVITDVPTTTSLSYNINQFEEELVNLDFNFGAYTDVGENETDGSGYRHSIIQKSFVDGVATLTLFDPLDSNPDTFSSHGYTAGYVIDVVGLGSPYDGTQVITAIPDGQLNSLQYRPDKKTIAEFTPRIALASGWGDGEFISYKTVESATAVTRFHGLSVNQYVEITGFTTNTGYNISGQVSGVFGSGTSFTLPSTVTPATNEPETGGTYYCYNGEVKAEADAVLFLTGVNPVPTSRNVVISWVADKPIDFRIVLWDSAQPDAPKFLEVDADTTESISTIFGINTYIWEVPEAVFQYAVYAEVLSGKEDVLLKECYVFESVGDSSKKIDKITGAYVDAVANNANELTFFTASPHSHEINDVVKISGAEIISNSVSQEFQVVSFPDDKRSFKISVPVVDIQVATVSGSNVVTTLGVLDPLSDTTRNQDVSGLIYVGQPYTSSNTTALPNGTVTEILKTSLYSNTATSVSATLVATSKTVTLSSGNTDGITIGQQVTKLTGTGVFGNSGTVYVSSVPNSSAFTVDTAHTTSGAVTFNTSLIYFNHESFSVANNSGATNSAIVLSFYLPQTGSTAAKTGMIATLVAGSNAVTLTSGNTNTNFSVGQLLTKTSGAGAFGNTGAVYVTSITSNTVFTVDANHSTSGSITFGTTAQNAAIALRASSIGGHKKIQTSTLTPSGLSITALAGGQAVNLTDDNASDNYLSIYNTSGNAVSTIDSVGKGTFANVDSAGSVTANSVAVDGTITSGNVVSDLATIGNLTANTSSANTFSTNTFSTLTDVLVSNTNTYVIGSFSNATYNNTTAYTDSYLNRLARGVVYNSYWDIPTTSIPSGVMYYGLASGQFELEADRAYSFFVGAGGIRYSPNTNAAMELLLSTTPIRLTDDTDLVRASFVLATSTYSGVTSQYFRDMSAIFQTVPATGSTFTDANTTNLTSATISSWSRASSSNTITVTLSNANPLSYYLKTGDYVSTNNMANANYHGTWQITKINTTAFSYSAYNVATAGTNTGTTGDITLVEPQMINTAATFSTSGAASATTNTVTYSIRNYFVPGQKVTVTGSLSPSTFLVSDAYVISANASAFTVSSTNVGAISTSTSSSFTVNWSNNQIQVNKTVLPSLTPIYWILRLRHGSNTSASVAFSIPGNPTGLFSITDIGQAKTLSYSAQTQNWTAGFPPGLVSGAGTVYTPPTTTTTTTTTYTTTLTVTSSDSAYYDNYGKGSYGTTDPYTNQDSLYQGSAGTSSGTKKSAVLFGTITYPGAHANNRVVTKVEVYLRNRHSYNASGLTTRIGMSTATSLGSSIPTTGVTAGPTPTSTTFTKGQGKWTTLGSGFHTYANASSLRTILISLTDQSPITYDSSTSNYGYFDGDNQTDPPKLRITYTYDVTT